jgi:hypothetical protein
MAKEIDGFIFDDSGHQSADGNLKFGLPSDFLRRIVLKP